MMNIKIHPPRKGTKLARLLHAVKGRGASTESLTDQLGWRAHTIRAAISRLRQRGYEITCTDAAKKAGTSLYQLKGPSK